MNPLWDRLRGLTASETMSPPNDVQAASRFQVRKEVISTRVLGCIVLLNPATEQYLTLSGVAARIWELVGEGLTPPGIAERLCEEYDAPGEEVATDVSAQLRSWLHQRLVAPAIPACEAEPRRFEPVSTVAAEVSVDHTSRPVVVPRVLQCGLMILAIKMMLKIRGFTWTVDWIRGRVQAVPASTSATIDAVQAVQWPVAMAAALYPGRARCLEQSLLLYYLLRRQGTAVRYCQGVKPFPFQAHAWIEYCGEPINDVSEHAQQFVRLPDQLP